MYNSRLENDWYLMCSDKTNKIAKLFYIKAGLFNRDQFDIDWEVTRKSRLPDKTKQFEVCICDDENYTEDIYKQVDFSDCLYATADFNENTIIKKEYDEDENDY